MGLIRRRKEFLVSSKLHERRKWNNEVQPIAFDVLSTPKKTIKKRSPYMKKLYADGRVGSSMFCSSVATAFVDDDAPSFTPEASPYKCGLKSRSDS